MKAPPLSRSSTPSTDRLSAPKPKPGFPTMAPSNPTTPVTPRIRSTPASSTTSSAKSLHPNLAARSPNPGARTSRTGTILGPETPTNRPLSVASIRPAASSASIRPTSSAGLRKKDLNPTSGRESPRFFHASDAHGQSPAARVKGLPLASSRGEKLPNTARISSGGAPAGATGPLLVPTAPKHGVANISPPTSRPTSVLAPSTPRQPEEMKAQGPLTPGLESGTGRNQVRFVYANGTEEILAPRNSSSDADSGSGLGASSPLPVSPTVSSGVSTATSPSKLGFPFSPMPSPHAQPTPQQIYQRHMSGGGGSRRSSIVNRHNRTVSIGSIGEMFKPAEETGLGIRADDTMLEAPQTPHVVTQEMEDLAATARRDRRVLDLEISNNSLSAINKTLEREMRKQASQLRRYKRLLRTPSAAVVIPAAISPAPQTDDEASTAEDSDDSDTSATSTTSHSTASTTHSPMPPVAQPQQPTTADSDADSDSDSDSDSSTSGEPQTRLGLDLGKHQALLDASAKMNASLQRCQLVTDALILEANKALEYKVAPDEVRLGGRVLRTYEESVAGETDDEVGFTEDEGGLGDDDEETENEGSGSEGSREVWLQRHSLF